jgi:hypothetical protein
VALFVALVVHQILLDPTWVGDDGDDGAYFLMSRNVWHYGAPLLNQGGSAHWSSSWSPVLPLLLSPLGALPMAAGIVTERLVVMAAGIVFLVLGYTWMRSVLKLSRPYAGIATACVAVMFALVRVSARVFSDVPAAAALLGGVVLLRRGRTGAGLALLALAALIRPINVAALVAAIIWLLLTRKGSRALYVVTGVALSVTAVTIGVAIVLGGYRGYFHEIANPGNGGVRETLVEQAKALSWYPWSWFSWPTAHGAARVFLKLASVGLLGLAGLVALRRRLALEALIVAVTVAVLLVYRTTSAGEARYLIPLAPLFVGAIFAGFQLLPRRAPLAITAIAGAAAIAAGLHEYVKDTPSSTTVDASVDAKKGAYQWVRSHVVAGSQLVALNDVQAFLYTGHATRRSIRKPVPGRTLVIRMPPAAASDAWAEQHILDGLRGRLVYRRGSVSVVEIDAPKAATALRRAVARPRG